MTNPVVAVALTFIVYALAVRLGAGLSIFTPILITIVVLMAVVELTGTGYSGYAAGGDLISFWLKPAVVALGVPLYRQLRSIRRQVLFVIMAELAGCVAGVISVVLLAQLLGGTREVVLSLASKSVTTPIAMEVTEAVGGFRVMKLARVTSPVAQSLSMGTAAHAVGTSMAISEGGLRYGAWGSVGLTLNGLLTALLTPSLLRMLDIV